MLKLLCKQLLRRFVVPLLIVQLIFVASPVAVTYAQTDPVLTQADVPQSVPVEMPDVVIDTGDSVAVTDTYSTDNTTIIETELPEIEPAATNTPTTVATDTPTQQPPTASSTPHATTTTEQGTSTPTQSLAIENHSSSTMNASTSANTGNNTVTDATSSTITTGDAFAYTNVVNLSNTNIINSSGFIAFMSQVFGTDMVDVRELFTVFTGDQTQLTCSFATCETQTGDYYLANQSTSSNTLTTTASTGGNQVSGSSTIIRTGDAYALSNLTNITNTNIIDANYLVFTFSNFGDLFGDIIFPTKYLFDALFSQTSSDAAQVDISNQATVTNNLSVTANSGDNTASGTGAISTGNATSYSNVYNQINQNILHDDSFSMLFRVHGDWDGQIFGLPDNLQWERTPEGISITNSVGASTPQTHGVTASIINSADLENNVRVSANTGYNNADLTGSGDIYTGDAYAAANITNIANTNVIGKNWSLLIFDIFGNWQGDISFGQPDVWIGGTAHIPNGRARAGSEVLYTITVSNLGDTEAKNVKLNGTLGSDLIALDSPIDDISLGSIAPGETIIKTFPARITTNLPRGSHSIDLTAELSMAQKESQTDNNQEVITIIAENISRGGGGSSRGSDTDPAAISITKTTTMESAAPGSTIGYEVTITNQGGPVFDSILYDTLYDANGVVMLEQQWPLHTIAPDESITVTYDIHFATSSPHGLYTNSAQVLGFHQSSLTKYMTEYDSTIASAPVQIGPPLPAVLGVATSSVCTPYLTQHLKIGADNDQFEVAKLQAFLKVFTDHTVPLNGQFDLATDRAVRQFQSDHQDTILAPWGLASPTGYVYYTTQKKINELYCGSDKLFPLSPLQQAEITLYRLKLLTLQ